MDGAGQLQFGQHRQQVIHPLLVEAFFPDVLIHHLVHLFAAPFAIAVQLAVPSANDVVVQQLLP